VAGGAGFGSGGVGGGRGVSAGFAVRAVVVVELAEAVELALQVGQGRRGWLLGRPSVEGLVEAFDLALGLRVAGVAVLLRDVEGGRWPSCSRCQAMVTGPASRPSLLSCSRSSTIRSRTLVGVAAELECGRREWASTASRPPSR